MGVASSYKLLSLLTPFAYTIQTVYTVHTAHIVYFVYTACTVYAVYTTYITDTAFIAFTVHTAYTVLTTLEQTKLLCLYVIWLYCFVWSYELLRKKRDGKTGDTALTVATTRAPIQFNITIIGTHAWHTCIHYKYMRLPLWVHHIWSDSQVGQTCLPYLKQLKLESWWNREQKNLPSPKPESRPRDLFRFACGHPEALY